MPDVRTAELRDDPRAYRWLCPWCGHAGLTIVRDSVLPGSVIPHNASVDDFIRTLLPERQVPDYRWEALCFVCTRGGVVHAASEPEALRRYRLAVEQHHEPLGSNEARVIHHVQDD